MGAKFKFKNGVCAIALAGLALGAWSQTTAMDLRQVYQAALEQDSSIRASRALADATRERLPQARAGLLPQISASVGRNHNNLDSTSPNLLGNPVTTNDKYFSDSKTVQLRQPLMNMQRWLQFEQAKSVVEEAEANLERDLQNLVVRVAGAYFEALLTDEQLELVLTKKGYLQKFMDREIPVKKVIVGKHSISKIIASGPGIYIIDTCRVYRGLHSNGITVSLASTSKRKINNIPQERKNNVRETIKKLRQNENTVRYSYNFLLEESNNNN